MRKALLIFALSISAAGPVKAGDYTPVRVASNNYNAPFGQEALKRVHGRIHLAFPGQCSSDDNCGVGFKCCNTECKQVSVCYR
jgi:hypothetical protein